MSFLDNSSEPARYYLRGFLSEMSAEPIHGGGITLQRVLGEQLQDFQWFAQTLWFPSQPWPSYPQEVTNLVFPWWQHERWLRRTLGCTRAYKLSNAGWIREMFARNIARSLNSIPLLREAPFLVCPQTDITLRVMRILQEQGPLNYITWAMDDHLVRWSKQGWEYPHGIEDLLRLHLHNARAVFVISNTMRDFYRERFSVDSIVLHAPAPQVSDPIAKEIGPLRPLRLVYFGSLGPWQNDALEVLLPTLHSREVELDIYTHQPGLLPSSLRCEWVRLCDPIPASDVQRHSGFYDATVLPLSFLDEMKNMSYFNIATKYAECLGGPVPMLLIGPKDAAMTKMARQYQAAVVVSEHSLEAMTSAMRQLRNKDERDKILKGARTCIDTEMSQALLRGKWKTACIQNQINV